MGRKIRHGESIGTRTTEYRIWKAMRERCLCRTHKQWDYYGGRGITICDRWRSFESFLADMGRRPSTSHCLERKDNDGGYSPQNCTWATYTLQNRNRRDNVKLTFNGKTMTVAEWADRLHWPRPTLYHRIRSGWSAERTLTTKHPHWP